MTQNPAAHSASRLRIFNRDTLKYLAIICLFVGHFLTFTALELRMFGLPPAIYTPLCYPQFIAPPIFFFFIAEGHFHTRSHKKYALRLLLTAIVTQFAFVLCDDGRFDLHHFLTEWNVMLTLFLGLVSLMIWDSKMKLPLRCLLILACGAAGFLLKAEWRIFGPLFILAFHLLRDRPWMRLLAYEIITLAYAIVAGGGLTGLLTQFNLIAVMTAAIVLITFFYNGKKGRHPRFAQWFFYAFYPGHFLLIYAVKLLAA